MLLAVLLLVPFAVADEEPQPVVFEPILAPANSSAAVEFPVVRRGRQVFYQCQIGNVVFRSSAPCNTLGRCSNGLDVKLNVGCSNAVQCTPYFNGAVKCENGCCCASLNQGPTNPAPPTTANCGICYHGQLSQVGCSARGQCQQGQTCMNGLCCTTTGNEYTAACGGLAAVSSCTNGGCAGGLSCTASNYCCECPVGRSAGRCNNGACPAGFRCLANGYCCASCPNNATPFGSCVNGACGNGRRCSAGNICC